MKKKYSENRKKLFLNNRLNEYCLFLKGVNSGIVINNFNIKDLSLKFSPLPLCKAIGVDFSINYLKLKTTRIVDL
jgi:hypothetical protein